MSLTEYIEQTEERTIRGGKFLPFYIPKEDSIRCFLGVANSWKELYVSDFIEATDTEFFSYSTANLVLSFPKKLIGNTIKVTYKHKGDLNPGSIDLAPLMIRSWSVRQNFYIKDGLYLTKHYVNGETGGDGWSIQVAGGSIIYKGEVWSVGENTHHLSKFGASNGVNNITGFIFFLSGDTVEAAGNTRFIPTMDLIRTRAVALGSDGGGKGTVLNLMYDELSKTYGLSPQSSGYLEIMRGFVISKGGDLPPELYIYYTKQNRVLDFKI